MPTQSFSFNKISIKNITSAINDRGYIIIENALPDILVGKLHSRIISLNQNNLQDAKVGQASNSRLIKEIRSDKTYWLDEQHVIDQQYYSLMDELRLEINNLLFLGLFEYECHYAVFEPGSFYKKHSDVLAGNQQISKTIKNRVLSSVLYLNKNWNKQDGGELAIYNKEDFIIETVTPTENTLVLFLSEQFPHEVKPTSRIRYSITGWFRVNNNT